MKPNCLLNSWNWTELSGDQSLSFTEADYRVQLCLFIYQEDVLVLRLVSFNSFLYRLQPHVLPR